MLDLYETQIPIPNELPVIVKRIYKGILVHTYNDYTLFHNDYATAYTATTEAIKYGYKYTLCAGPRNDNSCVSFDRSFSSSTCLQAEESDYIECQAKNTKYLITTILNIKLYTSDVIIHAALDLIAKKIGSCGFFAVLYPNDRIGITPKTTDPSKLLNDIKKARVLSLGRFIRRILGISANIVTPDMLDKISSLHILGISNIDLSLFSVLSGKAIVEAYRNAVGRSSCMTGDFCKDTNFYAMFPDQIKLLVYNKTKCRALLWICDDGTKLVDYLYTNYHSLHNKVYKAWVKYNNAYFTQDFIAEGKQVTLLEKDIYNVPQPYFDSARTADDSTDHKLILGF